VGDKARVGFLGGGTGWKGAGIAKEWASRTRDKKLEWHWFGNLPSDHQTELLRIGVVCHGRMPSAAIYSLLDCVVHPSVEFDPYPTVLLESARAGLPVVASDMGGSREIVRHGETGFLYDSKCPEAGLAYLLQLAEDTTLRLGMGGDARKLFEEKMAVQEMKNAYFDFWMRLAENGNA
jgi:glycosyltransferase involved in cell wall biosynthesis